MTAMSRPGRDAVATKGWLAAHKWLIARRLSQFGILGLFLAGPVDGVWIVKGNLTGSLTLGVLPLTDPFVLAQSLIAGHVAAATALIGAAIVLVFYALVGGRAYCAFVCPVNIVTDAARWLADRLNLPKDWQPARATRLWLLGAVLAAAAVTGVTAWESLNPVTLTHCALVYGGAWAWTVAAAVFVLDLVVARRGWCGHLCPQGAFYGLIGAASLIRVSAARREACNDCMDCFAVCPEPHVITPALRGADVGPHHGTGPVVMSGDCTNCGRCIDVCSKDVFRFDIRFNNRPDGAAARPGHSDSPPRKAA